MTTCATASPRWTRRASQRAATAGSTTTRRTSWRASTSTTRRPDSLCGACRTARRRIPASRPSGCGGGASRSGRRASRCTASASSGRSGEAPSAASHAEFRMPTTREQAREQDRKQGKQARSSGWIEMHPQTMCDECRHLFGSEDDRPGWSGPCDECEAQSDESAPSMSDAKRPRVIERPRCDGGWPRCDECMDLFGAAERPSWCHCNACDGFWALWNGERGQVFWQADQRQLEYRNWAEVADCVNTA